MGACQSNPNVIVSEDKVKSSTGVRCSFSFEGARGDNETRPAEDRESQLHPEKPSQIQR